MRYSVLLLLAVFAQKAMAAEPGLQLPKEKLAPFLNTYCVRCHDQEKQNGQVRFDTAAWIVKTGDEAQRWQEVLDQLNGGDMPPENAKQPSGLTSDRGHKTSVFVVKYRFCLMLRRLESSN